MSEQTFADGIGAITVVGATVRLDLVTLVPGEEGPGSRPKPSVSHRLIMPIDGFLAAARHVAEAAEAIRKLETPARTPGAAAKTDDATALQAAPIAADKPQAEPAAPPSKRNFP